MWKLSDAKNSKTGLCCHARHGTSPSDWRIGCSDEFEFAMRRSTSSARMGVRSPAGEHGACVLAEGRGQRPRLQLQRSTTLRADYWLSPELETLNGSIASSVCGSALRSRQCRSSSAA